MEPPVKPDESDCCNSGCNPCILDVYEEQLKKYKAAVPTQTQLATNCISPTSYTIFKLVNVEKQSEQAYLFTFEYCRPVKGESKTDPIVLYEPGQHFLLKGKVASEEFTRAYTPISVQNQSNAQFTVLVKLYEHGVMSKFLKRLRIGNETLWRGPYGEFTINYETKHALLIAQGTGVAPFYSIIHNIVHSDNCFTFLKLFYCCSDGSNIYLREQLYELTTYWNFTYEVYLSKSASASVKYNEIIHHKKLECRDIQGYVSDKLDSDSVNVLICGSENFMRDIKNKILDCKVQERNILTF